MALNAMHAVALGRRDRRQPAERVLVVGGGTLALQVVEAIEAQPDGRSRVVGRVDESTLRDLHRTVDRVRPDRVIVALSSRRGHMPFKALMDLRMRGIVIEEAVDAFERLTGKVPIEALTPACFIFTRDTRWACLHQSLSWAVSLVAAAIGLILLAPLMAAIVVAIKLDSPGPVFFIQPRVGRGGRKFSLIKFRTMRPATGATSEWARDNDARLTRVGRWLRRFRLDELPQFANVVLGDMNLVGPRPHPVSNLLLLALVARNTPECGEQIPFYALRSLVRPGLTGWAQVRYRYANDLEEEIEKMRYDLYYIKHRSLWLDLRIVAETVKVVVCGREGATPPRPAVRPLAARRMTASRAVLASGQAALARLEAAASSIAQSSLGSSGVAGVETTEGLAVRNA
jgi:exopolysaccharide biosynthesis polyprenyl glycosylphosphotransferase